MGQCRRSSESAGVGAAPSAPGRVVVNFAVVAGLCAVRPRTPTVAGVANDALVGGVHAFGAAQVQRPVGVVFEDAK
jgi:hypothetical protein